MEASTSIRPVTAESRPVLERMWQLYMHDLSQFRGTMPDAEGLYPRRRLLAYDADPGSRAYLIVTGEQVTGFTVARGLSSPPHSVGEFFVVRAARQRGVGFDAARELLRAHPGPWQIAFQDENPKAARFWRRFATAVAGDTWVEERRPVPNKPHIPPDVWITLDAPA